MINSIRDCPTSPFLRRFVGFDFKIRFLLSKYPPGIPRVESQILILKSDFIDLKATYRTTSKLKGEEEVGEFEIWLRAKR